MTEKNREKTPKLEALCSDRFKRQIQFPENTKFGDDRKYNTNCNSKSISICGFFRYLSECGRRLNLHENYLYF